MLFLFLASAMAWLPLSAQNGSIRGHVYDKESGVPIAFGTVQLFSQSDTLGTNTDIEGFFSFGHLPKGHYQLLITYVGYDSIALDIDLKAGQIFYRQFNMAESSIKLGTVQVSARKSAAKSNVQISKLNVSPKEIRALPSVGGEADIAQYLPVLPGIISTGDQGGQLYVRGGSPIQNLILLDGMTIYNPFHSIGFFSVFETDIIRNVEVHTGGFGASYGGRISAIIDINTREGDKKQFSGKISANPFMGKILVEGPLKKLKEAGSGSTSVLFTAKKSYIDKTSPALYPYAESVIESGRGLPYSFTDLYGKLSTLSGNGSKAEIFGFRFQDAVDYSIASLNWLSSGGGATFKLVPPNSSLIMGGNVAFSDYNISLQEEDDSPRRSRISSYSAQLKFSYFGYNNEVNYGFAFTGLSTDFQFRNFLGVTIQQLDFTTELAGFINYRQKLGKLIVEPGLRIQMYASQQKTQLEPRFAAKLNASDHLRFKLAGGLYSQNLLSTVNERDVVNLFVGFLSGPEQTIFEPGTHNPTQDRLQKAIHAVVGLEMDLGPRWELQLESYYKGFTQLIELNRNKLSAQDPDYSTLTGNARGVDLSLRYSSPRSYLWFTYSLGQVLRNDGEQIYPTIFDRRHNINALFSYTLGGDKSWEFSLRWNYGSPFPFTQTQGFYGQINFTEQGLNTNPATTNPPIGILYASQRNGGRLLPYHRLDVSLKKNFDFGLEIIASVTNAYNRKNIFYIDRRTTKRVDQLPWLPSIGLSYSW